MPKTHEFVGHRDTSRLVSGYLHGTKEKPHMLLSVYGRVDGQPEEWTPIVHHKTGDLELASRVLEENGANDTPSHPAYKGVGISDLKPLNRLIKRQRKLKIAKA